MCVACENTHRAQEISTGPWEEGASVGEKTKHSSIGAKGGLMDQEMLS